MIRTYSELISFSSFKERYEYLKIEGSVGIETFGFDRYLNQVLYHSQEWKRTRDIIILRDNGCDLAIPDREIHGTIIVHHMNPINEKDIINRSDDIFNPDFLICTSINTHNAIHYGSFDSLYHVDIERSKNDTSPWLQ